MKKLIALVLLGFGLSSYGQNVHYGTIFTFDSQQAESLEEYIASTRILLQNGFRATAVNGAYYRYRIGSDPTFVSPADYIQANDPNDRELDYSLPVGTVSGQASVSPNGSAIYDIPILVPPGTNGVQPSISVSYNSQSFIGLLGKGWNLNATSSISRVGQVSYIDDKITAVNCSFEDRYALDGQRLVLSSGSEGQTNCAYRTEIESFTDIVVTDIQGNGPKSFIVKTKDGQILEYGGTEDSRLLGDGSTSNNVLVWYLNKMTDQNGNYIIYKYRNANGECVLDRIEYTGNENENLLPYNVIKFNYSTRTDAGYAYFGGEKLNNTLILESIEIKCDFVTKLTYAFQYSNNGFASMLQEIILNDENGDHYNSLLVDWEEAGAFSINMIEKEVDEIAAIDYNSIPININIGPGGNTIRWSGDFNGDGLTDVLEYKEELFIYTIHLVDGTYEDHEIHGSAFRILINNHGDFIPSDIYYDYDIDDFTDVSIADIDNDGDDDFFARNDDDEDYSDDIISNTFKAFTLNNNQITELANCNFTTTQTRSSFNTIGNTKLVIGDFNGDNNNEYFCLNGNNVIFRVVGLPIPNMFNLCDFPAYSFELLNFNGNNKLDILVSDAGGSLKVFEYNEVVNSFIQISAVSNMFIEDYYSHENLLGDFNGDGLTDILSYGFPGYLGLNTYHLFVSNGSSFIDKGAPYAINANSHMLKGPAFSGGGDIIDFGMTGDYNGDGLTDYVRYSPTSGSVGNENLYIAYNQGNNIFLDYRLINQDIFSFTVMGNISYRNGGRITGSPINTIDYDGDGKNDIYAHKVTGSAKLGFLSFTDPSDHVLVEGMIDGLNHKTSFSYEKTAGNPDFYSKTMVNSPTTKVITPVTRLVSKLSTDAEPAPFETEYAYSDLLLNTEGKGMFGFAGLQSTDLNSGMRMTTRMSIIPLAEFPYISEQKVYLTHFNTDESDDELRMTNLTEITPSVSSAYGFYPITTSSVSIDHDLQTIIETVVDPAELDMYGNVLKSTSKVYNMTSVIDQTERSLNNLVQTKVTEISYNYSFETSKHLLGLPASTTETVTKTGSPAITSKMNFLYHPDGNIWKTIQNPSMFMSNKSVVTEMLGYNGCGMPTIKQVSAPNDPLQPPVRTESWEYDSKKRFVIAKTDAEGHTAYFSYNKVFGSVTKAVDIQGNVVTSEYDNFGNLLKSTDYLGLTTQYITEWNQNSSIDALYCSKVIAPNSPQSQSWFDENGRVVLAKTEGLNGDVYSEKEYNAHGQVERESLPHFSNEAPRYIEYRYYDDGRLQTKTYEGLSTHYTYDGRITTVTKPDGKTETSEVNALGLAFKNSDELGTVFYTYNSAGQVTNIQSGQSNTQFEYDPIYNWRTKTISPDLGEINFVYYATGELYRQTDALGNQLEYSYDVLGRVSEVKKFHAETNTTETITYSYNSTGNGVGQIDNVISTSGITQNYSYDQYGRLLSSQENIQGKSYSSSVEYNDNGQVTSQTYPYGYEVENEYNPKGFLTKIKQASDGQMIWQVVSENALGQRTQSLMGNGASLNLTYDPVYNTLGSIEYSMQNNAIWHQQYSFNAANGNLNWRSDLIRGMTEDFTYGLGDRLELVEINNGLQLNIKTVSYETNGNIAEKSDVGTYNYTGAQPHAVTEVYPYTGNEVLANQEVHYNATNKASTIEQDGMISTITYGPDDQRRKMVFPTGTNTTITRYYQSGFEEDEYSDGRNKKTYYISTPDGLTAMMIQNETGNNLYYVASDYLGSICGLMDETGAMQQEYSYDAWGARRDPATWQNYTQTQLTTYSSSLITDRGYTGHEMLDLYGLINMNGRMYDPLVGRFLSADPVIQSAGGSQGYNAYSYALNNPLKYTDPTGYAYVGAGAPPQGAAGNNDFDAFVDFYNAQVKQWSMSNYNNFYSRFIGGGYFNPSGDKIKKPTKGQWQEALDRAARYNNGDVTEISQDLTGYDISIFIDIALSQFQKRLSELFPLEADVDLLNAARAIVPDGFGLLATGEWIDRSGFITLGFTSDFKYGNGDEIIENPIISIAPWVIYSSENSFVTIAGHEIIHFNALWLCERNPTNNEYSKAAYGQPEGYAHTFSYQYAHDHSMRYPFLNGLEKQNFDWKPYLNFTWLSITY